MLRLFRRLAGARRECRVCSLPEERGGELMLAPCDCRGTMRWVHCSCLMQWLQSRCRPACEVCGARYRFRVERPRRPGFWRLQLLCVLAAAAVTLPLLPLAPRVPGEEEVPASPVPASRSAASPWWPSPDALASLARDALRAALLCVEQGVPWGCDHNSGLSVLCFAAYVLFVLECFIVTLACLGRE
ncbi:uncharacterized protein LOC134529122 [Bacillus rossius redtenbacheri]|uniref:uncharacterized protein LOC134529122 n=1 Tax=Bacillus rossius redtenbacheri TaxID=93214 RepID=UPI002FDEEE62